MTMTTTTKSKKTTKTAQSQSSISKVTGELPVNPFTFEVLSLASKQRTNAKKIEVLKKYDHPSLKAIFIWNFDESVVSALPPGEVPYGGVDQQNSFSGTLSEKITSAVSKMAEIETNSLGSQDQGRSSIRKEYQRFYNFVKGGNDSLSSLRRETMFINILEGLHPFEAEILCLVKDKKLQTKYKITKEIVSGAYPDIKWGGRS
jgi:hypothetical protein